MPLFKECGTYICMCKKVERRKGVEDIRDDVAFKQGLSWHHIWEYSGGNVTCQNT